MTNLANNTELENGISELNAKIEKEHVLKNFVSLNFPNIKNTSYINDWNNKSENIINFDCKDLEDFKHILKTLKPTNKKTVIGTASDKYYKSLKTPFRLNVKNPPVVNSAQNYEINISYISGIYNVSIDVPLSLIDKDFFLVTQRSITDSEYHYFIGVSMAEIRNRRLRKYTFANVNTAGTNSKVINWYGGDVTLCDETEIKTIIDSLLK